MAYFPSAAFALTAAAIAVVQGPAAAATPVAAPSAFLTGVQGCEALFVDGLAGRAPSGSGPIAGRGFVESTSGEDRARLRMLTASAAQHVYRRGEAGQPGVVYVAVVEAPKLCRVGGFDAPGMHEGALDTLALPGSGWTLTSTTSPTPAAQMRMFRKAVGRATLLLNLSWPTAGLGPSGLSAMASVGIEAAAGTSAAPPQRAALDAWKAHSTEVAKFVRVSVAWHLDGRCRFLSPAERSAFEADISASSGALRRLATPILGSDDAAQRVLADMQQKAAGYAAANYAACGEDARKVLTLERGEAKELAATLAR